MALRLALRCFTELCLDTLLPALSTTDIACTPPPRVRGRRALGVGVQGSASHSLSGQARGGRRGVGE
jgi:hypothetical protein